LVAVPADPSHRRTAKFVLTWAVAEVVLAVVALVVTSNRTTPQPTARPPAVVAPAPLSESPSAPAAPSPALPGAAPAAAVDAGAPRLSPAASSEPSPTPSSVETAGDAATTAAVSCRPDLDLAASPDAAYNFLCTQGGTPVTWPSDSVRVYTTGLTPTQTAALPVALAQWQTSAHFRVTRVTNESDADVVMTGTALTNNEDGYTSMHYVCATTCAYDHADVQLATNAHLTKTSWMSTILHELGHVAGLNHVARHGEVMYPEIDARSPAVYGSGDLAGFQQLANARSV
jgi:hypothetical protein